MTFANKGLAIWLIGTALISTAATLFLFWTPAMASDAEAAARQLPEGAMQWGFLAAALATGLSSLGAGIAGARMPMRKI